jgi:DNA-binding transcriptional LysR family regulator
MRVTLAQLESFFWIARLGSTQAAARQLRLAQPTISLRLRDLELALGVKLFDRLGRGLRLTDGGSTLLERTTAILGEMSKIAELGGTTDSLQGVVRVGVTETFALVCLPPLMQSLQRQHPLFRMEIVVATSTHLEDQVLGREVDLAFMVNPTNDPRLRLLPLGAQETSWLAAPSFGLSAPIRPQDVLHLPIICNPHPSPMYVQITEWFRSVGLEPPRLSFCNSLTVIAHLVEQGVFVGFLPRKLVETQIESGAIQALASHPPPISARIYAGYRLAEGSPAISAILLASRRVVDQIDFLEPS